MMRRWRRQVSPSLVNRPRPGLEKPARELGFAIIGGVVEQNMPNGAGLIDNKPPPPQQPAGNNVLVERLGRIGGKRIVANKRKELAERQRSVGPNR
jgi:hypothetical protein